MIENEVEIVIVEDNPNDFELMERVFKKYKLANKVIVFKDGAEALDYFFPKGGRNPRIELPKVIFMDLKLPKVNGLEVIQRLKSDEFTKKIPIIAVTSSQEPMDIETAYKFGANSYVAKPINFDEFSKVMSDLGMYWLLLNKLPNLNSPPDQ